MIRSVSQIEWSSDNNSIRFSQNSQYHLKEVYIEKKNKQNKQTMDSVDIYMIVQSVCIITGSKGEAGWLGCTLYNY